MEPSRKALVRFLTMPSALLVYFLFASPLALAQGDVSGIDSLRQRISSDELQAKALARQLQAEQAPAGQVRVAALFGESDEEKAARLQHEQNQDSSIATLNQRVGDLEETLRKLTGQMEQLDHRVSEFNDRVARMQKDFDYKLCTIAAQQLGATNDAGGQNALPCNGQPAAPAASSSGEAGPPASGGPVHLAPPPGVLGTLPESAVTNAPQQGSPLPPPTQTASVDTRSRFDSAMNLLARAQYDEARAAFRSFVDNYPKDDLAPQAIYWVGDISYVQKDYPDAAHSFAEALKKYPTSPRAPESMLKLGQSLIAMNQKKEGCLALGALPSKYPDASKSVTAQALAARRAAGCR